MLANISTNAGLGIPPISNNQNGNEFINSLFKHDLDHEISLAECVEKIKKFILRQQEQVGLALLNMGE